MMLMKVITTYFLNGVKKKGKGRESYAKLLMVNYNILSLAISVHKEGPLKYDARFHLEINIPLVCNVCACVTGLRM